MISDTVAPNAIKTKKPTSHPLKEEVQSSNQINDVSFQLKGRLFTLSVLKIQSTDFKKLDKELSEKIKLAPKFFSHAPVVIDVCAISTEKASPKMTQEKKPDVEIDFKEIKEIIEKNGLIPVGVKGTTPELNKQAQNAGFAIMTDNSQDKKPSKVENGKPLPSNGTTNDQEPKYYSKLVTQPIRSGQQVYSQGDLVIVSSVSPGAELLAEGNIHVYGTLRGRALAGINGSRSARIFCHQLEAELVSIAGQYKIFEDIQEHHDQTPKQLYLDDTQLIISSL